MPFSFVPFQKKHTVDGVANKVGVLLGVLGRQSCPGGALSSHSIMVWSSPTFSIVRGCVMWPACLTSSIKVKPYFS